MRVKFENPPINELVIATYFSSPISQLRIEHIGLFWSKINSEFTTIKQHPPVGGAQAFEMASSDFAPMPRFWFISEDQSNLIQVQKNAFMFNWRKRNGEYPHFAAIVKPNFDKYYSAFSEFLRLEVGAHDWSIDLCELTYINKITPCEYWNQAQDTSDVIPSFSVPDIGGGEDSNPEFNCTYSHVIANDLQLRIGIRSARLRSDSNVPVLVFEIRATGRLGKVAKSSADAWYERAHDAIISCFLRMTSKKIQSHHWKVLGETM